MIGVIGAGAFGTALAITLARSGQDVVLWARSAEHVAEMKATGKNQRYLPEQTLPETISPTGAFADLTGAAVLLAAVPLQSLRSVLQDSGLVPTQPIVACCKGIELNTGKGPADIIADVFPDVVAALLTGPSFAADIAIGRPTALTLACADPETGATLQSLLTTQTLRLYRTTDIRGAQLGGALKNVIAIACGAVIGAGLGDSARAAIMTRGFAEMARINEVLGGRPETLTGLSGLGDLALTCTSDLSRNYRLGLALGRSESFDSHITVEGAATARAMTALARQLDLDLPITEIVTRLVDGKTDITGAVAALMTRPLKEE